MIFERGARGLALACTLHPCDGTPGWADSELSFLFIESVLFRLKAKSGSQRGHGFVTTRSLAVMSC